MALATLHNPTVAHQIQLFEQELSQGISEGLGCDALGLVALCQRLGIIVPGEDCAEKSLQPSHSEKRRKQTKTQTQIVTEVCLGSQSCRFSVLSRKERFKDMLEAFPSGWQVGKATAEEVLGKIHQHIKRFGERHGWAKMGKWIFAQTAYRAQAVAFDEQLAGHRSVPDQVEGLARGENGQVVF